MAITRGCLRLDMAGGAAILAYDLGESGISTPWAGVGTLLTVAPDGTLTGDPYFWVYSGNNYGITIQGVPFLLQRVTGIFLYVDGAPVPSLQPTAPNPDGSTVAGYAATIIFPGALTGQLSPGIHTYQLQAIAASGAVQTLVAAPFRVLPSGIVVVSTPQALVRGQPAVVTLAFSNVPGASLDAMSLLWRTSGAGTLAKAQSSGQIAVAGNVATIPLSSAETAALDPGVLSWTIVDANSQQAFPTGKATVT